MTTPSRRLAELNLRLPAAAVPAFDYVPATVHGDLMFVSGQLPKEGGEVRVTGTVGAGVTIAEARRAAEVCVLQGLACAAEHLGGLDRVARVLRVTGYVASTPDFHDQPRVVDAASELLGRIFAEEGRHARSAVGVIALPRMSPVEVELILAVHP
jgi:enamine deaminase RidA (YjgF/YER057c/UK114 family)